MTLRFKQSRLGFRDSGIDLFGREDNLFLQSRLRYFFGEIDHPAREKTYERETLESSAVAGEPPPLSARWHFFSQRERKPMLAKELGDVPISPESPRFLLRRVRPPGRKKLTSAKKLGQGSRGQLRLSVSVRRQ